jgi:type IV fimbrial biogenesis protein FimT
MAALKTDLRNAPTISSSNPLRRRVVKGFTLVEVIATLALGAVLFSLAVPFYSRMAAYDEVRSATESIVYGLGVARQEAIRRNERVTFTLDGTHLHWTISLTGDDSLIRSSPPQRPEWHVRVTTMPATARSVVFGPLGISVPDAMEEPTIQQLVVASTLPHNARALHIKIEALRTRVCDPSSQRAAPDPKAC